MNDCLACLDRFVAMRNALHGVASPEPVSPRLTRRLDQLLGRAPVETFPRRVLERVRRALVFRVPAWAVAGVAAGLVVITWAATQQLYRPTIGVRWPLPDSTQIERFSPARQEGSRTVSGVISSIRDATSNGVDAHVLSLRDASGATYVLFTWGPPTVKPGDAVEIEALFTSVPQGAGPPVYQGVVTELRRAR